MGIGSKVSHISQQLQDGFRITLTGLLGWSLKLFSAFVIGLTFALIGQEAFRYGNLAFLLVLVVGAGLILRWIGSWTILNVVVFDLICVLVGLSLKMYIMLAP